MRTTLLSCGRIRPTKVLTTKAIGGRQSVAQKVRAISTIESDRYIQLPDGRQMGFSECGDPGGAPLLYFHGFPSSRLEGVGMDRIAHRRKVRVLTLERPGFGISTPQPGRRIIDFVEDVSFFAGYMGLERFAVLGGSGGGPYALACAHELPRDMLSAVGLFASGGPYDKSWEGIPMRSRLGHLAAKHAPSSLGALGTGFVRLSKWALRGPFRATFDAALVRARDEAGESRNNKTLAESREDSIRTMFEGFAQGPNAFVEEATALSVRSWGFELENIDFPVQIWHGEKDANAPIQWIRNMAVRIPHSRLTEYPEETHYSMVKHLGEVLTELLPDSVGRQEYKS